VQRVGEADGQTVDVETALADVDAEVSELRARAHGQRHDAPREKLIGMAVTAIPRFTAPAAAGNVGRET
jgi:hypothetical protein